MIDIFGKEVHIGDLIVFNRRLTVGIITEVLKSGGIRVDVINPKTMEIKLNYNNKPETKTTLGREFIKLNKLYDNI